MVNGLVETDFELFLFLFIKNRFSSFHHSPFTSYPSPPQPAGCVTATPLLLLLWYPDCIGITNSSSVGTEPKEAAYAITGDKSIHF
jgi:hypothetical protein